MRLSILSGTANSGLAAAMAAVLSTAIKQREITRFPDGELGIVLHESVRGDDVYLVQPAGPPVNEHFVELLLLADACRRDGAARITAVMPYVAYARQDRRAGRSAVGGRLMADVLASAGVDGVVAVDVHTPAIEGFFSAPVEHLSAVPLLADRVRSGLPRDSVVVAPDLGAAKLAERYARILDLPVAFVHKRRIAATEVAVHQITGDVAGRAPLIVDDMISTGATIEAASNAVLAAGARPAITVAATHALLVGQAVEWLRGLGLRRLVVTDSVRLPVDAPLPLEVVSLDRLLAEAVERLHGAPSPGAVTTPG
jgi:ribose-phosphate pyrophosphokinase